MTWTNATASTTNRVGDAPVVIRRATEDDARALLRLAALDSGPLPEMALVAEVGGELWAARSLRDGVVVADPFRHTAELVELLHERARHLLAAGAPRRRPLAGALAAALRPTRHGVRSG